MGNVGSECRFGEVSPGRLHQVGFFEGTLFTANEIVIAEQHKWYSRCRTRSKRRRHIDNKYWYLDNNVDTPNHNTYNSHCKIHKMRRRDQKADNFEPVESTQRNRLATLTHTDLARLCSALIIQYPSDNKSPRNLLRRSKHQKSNRPREGIREHGKNTSFLPPHFPLEP